MILYNLIINEETGKLLVSVNRDLTNRLFIFFSGREFILLCHEQKSLHVFY